MQRQDQEALAVYERLPTPCYNAPHKVLGDTVGSLLRLVFIAEIDVLWGHELVTGYELDISIRVDSYLL